MRGRKTHALALLAVLGILPPAVRAGDEAPPARPLAEWVEILRQGDDKEREEAARALGRLGEGALDAVDALRDALKDRDSDVQEAAARALGRVGEGAKNAVPALVAMLKSASSSTSSAAVEGLAGIGKPAAAPLIKALQGDDWDLRDGASRALAAVGAPAVPELADLLRHPKTPAETRLLVVYVFRDMGEKARDAVPAILNALDDKDISVRRGAAAAMKAAGADPKEAFGPLFDALLEDDGLLADHIVQALASFGEEILDPLADGQRRGKALQRLGVAKTLGLVRADATRRVLLLGTALRDSDSRVRAAAVESLGRIGPECKEVVPALIKALRDKGDAVRASAARALGRFGAESAEAVSPLMRALKDKDPEVRTEAAVALGAMGARAKSALPALIDKVKDGDENRNVFRAVADALKKIKEAVEEEEKKRD